MAIDDDGRLAAVARGSARRRALRPDRSRVSGRARARRDRRRARRHLRRRLRPRRRRRDQLHGDRCARCRAASRGRDASARAGRHPARRRPLRGPRVHRRPRVLRRGGDPDLRRLRAGARRWRAAVSRCPRPIRAAPSTPTRPSSTCSPAPAATASRADRATWTSASTVPCATSWGLRRRSRSRPRTTATS